MSDIEDKQRIIDVASQRFREQGISKVTLDEIASELGMSKKTVYKFFPSKEDLLTEVVHGVMNNLRARVEGTVASDKPFAEKASELLGHLGRIIGTTSKQFLIDLQRFSPDLWKEMDEFRRQRILTSVRAIFVQAIEEGAFRKDLNVDLFILVFLNSAQNIINPQVLATQSFSMEEAVRGIFRIIFEGAMTEEARKNSRLFEKPLATMMER
jgi:AcrR family transcriptional regulator